MRGMWKTAIGASVAIMAALGVWFFAFRIPPITEEFLQGEWVQDPDFLQHAGQDLDAQKNEIDRWENYEFAFAGKHLSGWRILFAESAKNMGGWTEGKGVEFESDYTLAAVNKAVSLRFTDHTQAPAELRLAREGDKIAVAAGERKLRLIKGIAANLRASKPIPAK